MSKVSGVLFFILSVFLGLWCLLSILGLSTRILSGLPEDSYSWGVIAGQLIVYIIFGILSVRAFKAGRKRFSPEPEAEQPE